MGYPGWYIFQNTLICDSGTSACQMVNALEVCMKQNNEDKLKSVSGQVIKRPGPVLIPAQPLFM